MKKHILFILSIIFSGAIFAQSLSVSPGTARIGDSLTVTFTGTGTKFLNASDFYMDGAGGKLGNSGVTVNNDTSALVIFEIPLNNNFIGFQDVYAEYFDTLVGNDTAFLANGFFIDSSLVPYNKVTGQVYYDENLNSTLDSGEAIPTGAKVVLSNGSYGFVNSQGNYFIGTFDTGSYTISVIPPYRSTCVGYVKDSIISPSNDSIPITITGASTEYPNNNFRLKEADVQCGDICGNVFFDTNQNGVRDAGENGQSGVTISITPGGYRTTDANGDYCFTVPLNTPITVDLIEGQQVYNCNIRPFWSQTFPTSSNVYQVSLNSFQPDTSNINFGVYGDGTTCYNLGIYSLRMYNGTVSGGDFRGWMDFKMYGNRTDSCYLTLQFNPLVLNLANSLAPISNTAGNLTWQFAPGSTYYAHCMQMDYHIDTNVQIGDTLTWYATYDCKDSMDCCSYNNSMTRNFVVTSEKSGAPNTMEVYYNNEAEQTHNTTPLEDSSFSYVINFHNTTPDTIFHLRITDTLPDYFVSSSISTPFSSHPYSSFSLNDDNVAIWEFDNITLPPADSNEIKSYGFTQFNVILKQGLVTGTTIENKATITMNHETIVTTNTVKNILDIGGLVEEKQKVALSIYPNPSSDIVNIQAGKRVVSYELYDFSGRSVLGLNSVNNKNFQVDLSRLSAGIYYLKANFKQGKFSVSKIVKK